MSNLEKESCGSGCGCKPSTPDYWQDVENKVVSKAELMEFPEGEFDNFSVKKTRRNFLKIMGYSVSALPLTGCIKIPVRKALPYTYKQNTIIPGVANWYASAFNGLPVLLKTREGRPIKVEGNEKSSFGQGGANAQAQASVLSLYDTNRLREPSVEGNEVSWEQFDDSLKKLLSEARGRKVLITKSLRSPSELSLIKELSSKMGLEHIAFDAVSSTGEASANSETHGVYTLSEFDFEQADVVVSFGNDFLGAHRSDVANAKQFSKRRNPKHSRGMNKHIQVESNMSLTGSNADHRFTRSEQDQRDILLSLAAEFGDYSHMPKANNKEVVAKMINELKASRGNSLVLSGSNDKNIQILVNQINHSLGNYGKTIFVSEKSYEKLSNDQEIEQLIADMNSSKVGAVFFAGVDPVYALGESERLKSALGKVRVRVAMVESASSTSNTANFIAPTNHVYESWSDEMVSSTELAMVQPAIQPLFGTRMWTETLMSLGGVEGSFYDYMKNYWGNRIDWNQTLHDGVAQIKSEKDSVSFKLGSINSIAKKVKNYQEGSGLQIIGFKNYAIGDGTMANNPWLQELPDPITKATWDNHALISPAYAKSEGLATGDIVEITSGKTKLKLPVIVQPGVAQNAVAIALGYGHSVGGKVSRNLGANAYSLVKFVNGSYQYSASFGTLKKVGTGAKIARTQTHQYMEGRDIVRETTFNAYKKNPKAGNDKVFKLANVDIYPAHKKDGHQWAMAINMSSCTGCSACIVSCNAENNVPVVGKTEIARKRDMHWLRLDRYYKGDDNEPEVVHQPMLCQHCENAPCENVCPVLATVHSADGINQQIYNRCVGTRYCANNCPYKVRRFNWFNYDRGEEVERMVLNPDISQRTRGIMEKCSFCIQRIQDGKLKAKRERRELQDGDIKVACQQSCPSNAIVFGDMMNPETEISKQLADERKYVVLEELNVQPRVNYLTKIRNK